MSDWAYLRQVVVATTSHDADLRTVRAALGLGAGFDDPELKKMNLADATMPVSATRYLEFVAPIVDEGPVASWLAKTGPRGGYTLSVQHPDPDAVRARCHEAGVRVPIDELAFGRQVLQLHPKDVGLVLEIDGIPERDVWFWDDIDPGPEPNARVDEIVGVEIAVADPEAMAALWVRILGIPEPTHPTVLDLGATVRFVPGGPSPDWTILLRSRGDAVDPALPGITFRFV
ncbi:MAG: hypothetical protein ACTHMS_22215 [Jatrophihabitans sp.]|uniref:hypothetical protein n=1 Tax=Jatrophihabitans sp. TaxID=1932789 RepID=UPI003F802066